jgi:hypothetical protein
MPTKTRAREYLAKAKQYEQRAKKVRDLKDREWHLTLARAYRVLKQKRM